MIQKRRGAVAVMVAVTMAVLIGFAALVIDVGVMYNVRNDLQRTADGCALAAASAYIGDDMAQVRLKHSPVDFVVMEAKARAIQIGLANSTVDLPEINIGRQNIIAGYADPYSAAPIDTAVPPEEYNAFMVTARMDGGDNKRVDLYFAKIFGQNQTSITASAVAAFDDRFQGVKPTPGGATILPFTMSEDAYRLEVAKGMDQYEVYESSVSLGQDGLSEIRLFPYPLSGSGYAEGDGNFGFLNIGNPSQSAAVEKEQILTGITAQEAAEEFGSSSILFYDDEGNPVEYIVSGSPGLSSTVESEIASRIGDTVAFFLHREVVLSGANAIYTITDIVYAKVVAVNLNGALRDKYFYVQPTIYAGDDIIVGPNAPNSGTKGQLVLVR